MIATKAMPKSVRVGIYSRVSLADGLEKEFNSIDAQREACEAYVASQRSNGWVALPHRYDDGGFTGANTDRPAFQRLLADVKAGKVDVVAVYKIDRLSRSLVDFAQLLDTLHRHGVGVASVTQSFDSSTPMGRMVVNLLATFAQFERETTSERVRDKMLATRRKGMWTGGCAPLGYDVREKKLVVNTAEAERVRAIFALYRDLGSLLPVVHELHSRGWTAKTGQRFSKTSLHALLTNPLHLGKIRAGTELVVGRHEAIVDQETWDAVQAQLARGASTQRGWRPPKRDSALLRGLLVCKCSASMIHHSARRHGRAYHSYVCARILKQGAKACPGSRASMGALDLFVLDHIRAVGRDTRVLEATVAADHQTRDARRQIMDGTGNLACGTALHWAPDERGGRSVRTRQDPFHRAHRRC